MPLRQFLILPLLVAVIFTQSCSGQERNSNSYQLTAKEQAICDSQQLDPAIITLLRKYSTAALEPFHYSLGKMYSRGVETETDPIHLPGILFIEAADNADKLVYLLKDSMKHKGYTIFKVEFTGNSKARQHSMGIVKGTDQLQLLKQIGTDGINYTITNDSLLTIIKDLHTKYQLELIGASGDHCEFIIHRPPADWNQLAQEVYRICPDAVEQGTGTLEALAADIKQHQRLYFWWD